MLGYFHQKLCFILTTLIFSLAYGMKEKSIKNIIYAVPPNKYQKNISTYQGEEYLSKILKKYINLASKNDVIHLNANILTSDEIVSLVKEADQKGASVTILGEPSSFSRLSLKSKNTLKEMQCFVYNPQKKSKTKIDQTITGNHAKISLFNIKDDYYYIYGSSNLSNNGFFANNELNQACKGDKENYMKLLTSFKTLLAKSNKYGSIDGEEFSPVPMGKNGIKTTPEKSSVYTSDENNLDEIITGRLSEEKFAKGDKILISSFTFNNEKLTKALCSLLEKGVYVTIYLDKDPLTHEKNTQQIKQLVENGAKIYVCIKKNLYSVHHSKFTLINRSVQVTDENKEEKSEKILYSIISTLNMVPSNDFNALKIDREQQTYEDIEKISNEYEKNKEEFTLLTKENIDELKTKIEKQKAKKTLTKKNIDEIKTQNKKRKRDDNDDKKSASKKLKFD